MIATLAWNSTAQATTKSASEGDTVSILACPAKIVMEAVDTPPILPIKPFTIDKIKQRIADVSQEYGLDYGQLSSVIQCESRFKPLAIGDGGLAFGIAQFHEGTFNEFCHGNYYSTDDQLTCMAQMFAAGQARHWSCFKRMYDEVIYRPNSDKENYQLALQEYPKTAQ